MKNQLRKIKRKLQSYVKFPIKTKTFLGDNIYVNLFSGVGVSIHRNGNFDPAITETIIQNLHEGDVFIDIGANIGFYSVVAHRLVGNSGRVFSFEIDPRSLRCLLLTKEKFKYNNLIIISTALGATETLISIREQTDPGHTHINLFNEKMIYPMVKLDNFSGYFKDSKPSLIKIDVEGYEFEVLKGAMKTLQNFRPKVIIELNNKHLKKFDATSKDIFDFFSLLNYGHREISNGYEISYLFYIN